MSDLCCVSDTQNVKISLITAVVMGTNTTMPQSFIIVAQNRISMARACIPNLSQKSFCTGKVGWLVVLKVNVDLAIFQPYLDLEAGDNQSLKIQVERPGIEPRSSCSTSQELNHSATAAPLHG